MSYGNFVQNVVEPAESMQCKRPEMENMALCPLTKSGGYLLSFLCFANVLNGGSHACANNFPGVWSAYTGMPRLHDDGDSVSRCGA